MFEGKVECPRCHGVWTLPQASPGIYCNCHLWCPKGSKPSDCNLTKQEYNGSVGWPVGMDLGQLDEGADVIHRTYYCSVHKLYSYKEPIWLEVDWEKWYQQRKLPARLSELQKR